MLVWLSLLVALAAVVGGIAFLATRALALWRQVKATSRAVGAELDRVARAADAVAGSADGLDGATDELDASLARLSVSRARLRVLQQAWSEATDPLRSAREYLPREKKA